MEKLYDVTLKCAIQATSYESAAEKMYKMIQDSDEEWMFEVENVSTREIKEIYVGHREE